MLGTRAGRRGSCEASAHQPSANHTAAAQRTLSQNAGTGCSSGAAYTRSVRKRAVAVGLLLACVATTQACSAPEEAEGSALCDALGAPVPGIDEIVGDNGFTRQEANWATLLDSGILDSNAASRRAAADAAGSDTDGFERVLDAAPAPLRPDLERLRAVLMRPEQIEEHRSDPVVVESVQAVRDATPPEVCSWMR